MAKLNDASVELGLLVRVGDGAPVEVGTATVDVPMQVVREGVTYRVVKADVREALRGLLEQALEHAGELDIDGEADR